MANSPICSIPDCGKRGRMRRGMCQSHYCRFIKYGDPLAGKTPKGEVARYFDEVVVPHRGIGCLVWPYARDYDGYGKIRYAGISHFAHRLACERVHGPPPSNSHEAAHLCGNGGGGCCNPMHLTWATSKQNKQHKFVHGTILRGSRVTNSKLKECDVREIKALIGQKPMREIARDFGVSRATVADIRNKRRWAWLE